MTPDPQKFDTDFSFLIPKQKIQIEVSVTGIANGPDESSRLVDFSWAYVKLPKHLGWVAISGGSATAKAALYDDGWRIQEITNRKLSNKAYVSGSEKEELEAYVGQLEEMRRAAENAVAKDIARLIQRVKDSRVATRDIKAFRFENTRNADHYFSLVVTNVGAKISHGNDRDFERTFANSRSGLPVAHWNIHAGGAQRTINIFEFRPSFHNIEANDSQIEEMFEAINLAHEAWLAEFADVVWACQLIRSRNVGCDHGWESRLERALVAAFSN